MRLVALLIFVVLVYFFFVRMKPAQPEAAPHGPESTNFLKQPIDRAKSALDANRKRVSEQP